MGLVDAKKQFEDSFAFYRGAIDAIVQAKKNPDQELLDNFNLYAGLLNLTEGLEDLDSKVRKIMHKFDIR